MEGKERHSVRTEIYCSIRLSPLFPLSLPGNNKVLITRTTNITTTSTREVEVNQFPEIMLPSFELETKQDLGDGTLIDLQKPECFFESCDKSM
jgi:hypothetical protein